MNTDTLNETFIERVRAMREHQKLCEEYHYPSDISKCKRLEKEIDNMISEYYEQKSGQQKLF